MGNAILISASMGWFIGLLVLMVVLSGLFACITVITLKPYKIEGGENNSSHALKLLEDREAELTAKLLGGKDDNILNELNEVSKAKSIVKELLDKENGGAVNSRKLGVDKNLTEEEALSLESEGAVSIEQTFKSNDDGSGLEKSFTANLMQASDDVKVWYFELKNCILCYEKTKNRMRWNNEKFYIGRENVATLTMRGKQLCLYLAVDASEYSDRFPVKNSTSKMYNEVTPCLFKIRNANSIKQAKELIALMMADYGVMYLTSQHSVYALPYEDDDALVAKGLAKKKEN